VVRGAPVPVSVAMLVLVLAGCSTAVSGLGHPDPQVVAQLERERGCQSATDDVVVTVSALVQRIDTDASAVLDSEAIMSQIPAHDLGENLGRQCGREMIGSAYSDVLVRVQALAPVTAFGRLAHNAVLRGLCNMDQTSLDLETEALVVCAGR
jgi:hypothetical protein